MCIGITGGTGTPPNLPYIQSGAVSGDNIGYSHVIEFCKPSAGVWFNEQDEPPKYSCGDFTRNLDAYPLNDATIYDSITGNYKFGYSEMVLVYARLENYPRSGGYIKMDFMNPAGQVFYTFQKGLPIPDPYWDWWYAWVWGVVGRFDHTSGFSADEIVIPGNYRTVVSTPWGSANVDYLVTGTIPNPDIIISSLYAEYRGNGEIFVQWNQAGAGDVWVVVNGMGDRFTGHDSTNTYTIMGMQPGTHTICIEGTNIQCTSVTIQPLPDPTIFNLAVDKTTVILGNSVVFTAVGFPAGKEIELYEKGYIGLDNKLLGKNTTGIFTVNPGATHNYFVRYFDLINWVISNEVSVTVTDESGNPLNGDTLQTLVKYIPLAIGAYVLAAIIGRK